MHPAPPPARPLTAPPSGPRLSPEGHDPHSTERVAVTGRLRRLLVWYGLATLGVYLSIGAVNAVLLPLQVEELDPARKAANLAVVTVTRRRWPAWSPNPSPASCPTAPAAAAGRRAPWILTGALVAAAGLLVLGGLGDLAGLAGIAVVYLLVNVALALYLGPKSALMPDRVPSGVRGLFSAVAGLGVLLGVLGGQALGAALADAPLVGLLPARCGHRPRGRRPGAVQPRPRQPRRAAHRRCTGRCCCARSGSAPRRHPDFAYGFLGRLLTFTGFYLVNTFQLFLLQDYVGLGDDAVERGAADLRSSRC